MTDNACHRPYVRHPVLFDLDGTITDSAPIITDCFALTMKKLSGWDKAPSFYRKYVGPPLPNSFVEMGADDVNLYVRTYREFYVQRMYDTPFFPGMEALLRRLNAAGVPMVVATSKRTDMATVLLDHLGVSSLFLAVCGSPEGHEDGTKAERVGEALTVLREAGVSAAHALMVGDRFYDTEGAGAYGIPAVLVTWGEGNPREWAQAWKTADSVEQLEEIIMNQKVP